ncbi:MAG: hypothetical protein OCD76_02545 [Reichenbachiella sp.]
MAGEGMQFWTHENHAVEMNSNDLWNSRVNYIHQNPVREGWVAQAKDYLYSSASSYAVLQGLVAVEMI